MNSETEKLKASVGEMHKRRETMEDGRRYIIYYTFGDLGFGNSDLGLEENQSANPKSKIQNPKSESEVGNV